MRVWGRIIVLAMAAAGLAGCASDKAVYSALPPESAPTAQYTAPPSPIQCVPYAREHSSVKIFGDAWTWWGQAAGKFPREAAPELGSVMVLAGYSGPRSGHVAVVRSVTNTREIRVDHANWLDDGAIYVDDPVADVSSTNDWSEVRVWNIKTGAWGGRIYPVQGFIGPVQGAATDLIANADPIGNLIAGQ
ncbi:MAG TPA: CHAP domain-containing protein [Rhizomicrobium sp.]|jgi:surface antigen|nr:CHAP domain-containing protein [Rhizomicrobium sp.]